MNADECRCVDPVVLRFLPAIVVSRMYYILPKASICVYRWLLFCSCLCFCLLSSVFAFAFVFYLLYLPLLLSFIFCICLCFCLLSSVFAFAFVFYLLYLPLLLSFIFCICLCLSSCSSSNPANPDSDGVCLLPLILPFILFIL